MDLEHHKLGDHCSMVGCNQRDFLPFTCDICSRKLCLQHRSYINHDCSGEGSKNYTSIACPICSKTIKYTINDNLDIMWENHYLNSCTQKASVPIAIKSCPACKTKLGLTNTYHCKQCNTDLCLSHRSPDDHNCIKINSKRKNYFENKFKKETKTEASLVSTKPHQQNQYSCPICSQGFRSTESLNEHIDSIHIEKSNTPVNTLNERNEGGEGSEVCPVCNKKFKDPIALVNHFELKHNNIANNSTSNPNNRSTEGDSLCCIS